MPETPMPGVNGQLFPLHGARSISSLDPAARTDGLFASTAIAGSFCLFCGNVVCGLPLLTSTSLAATAGTTPATRANPALITNTLFFGRHWVIDPIRIRTSSLTMPTSPWSGTGRCRLIRTVVTRPGEDRCFPGPVSCYGTARFAITCCWWWAGFSPTAPPGALALGVPKAYLNDHSPLRFGKQGTFSVCTGLPISGRQSRQNLLKSEATHRYG